jgi:hypothetical protein
MKRLLAVSGVLEAATGLGLLAAPSFVVSLLLGEPLTGSATPALARVCGSALLALGAACWLARKDAHSRAALGVVGAMVIYNVLATAVLLLQGLAPPPPGAALWPAVIVHAVLLVWCLVSLRGARAAGDAA